MRGAELFLALPWIYLLFALRAFLPLSLDARQAFLLLIGVIGLTGWARPSRLIRGVTLSAKQRNYVLAARGFGVSGLSIVCRHILPEVSSVVLTQAALLVPQYILAEVTFSFLGLGVGEPEPSCLGEHARQPAELREVPFRSLVDVCIRLGTLLPFISCCFTWFADSLQRRFQVPGEVVEVTAAAAMTKSETRKANMRSRATHGGILDYEFFAGVRRILTRTPKKAPKATEDVLDHGSRYRSTAGGRPGGFCCTRIQKSA